MGTCRHVDLFLVRHGVTDWNIEKRYLGHTDREVLQGELTQLSLLKEEWASIRFDYVFTSDLQRCQSTLAYLNPPNIACVDSRLREMNFGDWEGKRYEDLKDKSLYRKWIDDWEFQATPNGESGSAFKRRLDSFIKELLQEMVVDGKVLIMTHGGVIRYFLSRLKAVESFWEISVTHGQGIQLRLTKQEGKWLCNSLSVVPFRGKEK